jgi:hypothetical protein
MGSVMRISNDELKEFGDGAVDVGGKICRQLHGFPSVETRSEKTVRLEGLSGSILADHEFIMDQVARKTQCRFGNSSPFFQQENYRESGPLRWSSFDAASWFPVNAVFEPWA